MTVTTRQASPAGEIEVEGLVHEYRDGTRSVDGIDLQVQPGEIYGFLGPNGAGKSTTVRILTTLLRPTAGKVVVAGEDVVRAPYRVRRTIGAALQEVALDPILTPLEHLRLQCGLHGLRRAERARRCADLVERLGLGEVSDRRVGGLSGGTKRRVDLALALVHRPTILFLDEPSTGLDVRSRVALWDEVRALSREDGVTVFVTTQYLEEADVLADRVGIVDHGRLVTEGSPAALKARIARPSVDVVPARDDQQADVSAVLACFGQPTVGRTGGLAVRLDEGTGDVSDLLRALDAQGLDIAHLAVHAPSLDDVFMAKTGRPLEVVRPAGDASEPVNDAERLAA